MWVITARGDAEWPVISRVVEMLIAQGFKVDFKNATLETINLAAYIRERLGNRADDASAVHALGTMRHNAIVTLNDLTQISFDTFCQVVEWHSWLLQLMVEHHARFTDVDPVDILKEDIRTSDLSSRVYNALRHSGFGGVLSTAMLSHLTADTLSDIRNLGDTGIREIRRFLQSKGLDLKRE